MGIIVCAYTYMLATIKWWLAGGDVRGKCVRL